MNHYGIVRNGIIGRRVGDGRALLGLGRAIFAFVGLSLSLTSIPAQQLLPPSPYRCFSDSPFARVDFSEGCFYLEDFEDRLFNAPGVSHNGGRLASSFGPSVDSVDCDDGAIDGQSCGGEAWWNFANPGMVIDFDRNALGFWPTHVGFVWTDTTTDTAVFRAYDQDLQMIAEWTGTLARDNNFSCNDTDEDRFLGVIYGDGVNTGIRRITMSVQSTGGMEIDHLQYGNQTVPCPCVGHRGDVNADGCVDDADLLAVLFAFGQSGGGLGRVDVNCDRVVDDADLAQVLSSFGNGC